MMISIISLRSNSKRLNPDLDKYLYRSRHLVENAFARLKHFRAIATWFDKLDVIISLWSTLLAYLFGVKPNKDMP